MTRSSTSNIEIKARARDLKAAAATARSLGATLAGEDLQVDTYFTVPAGRLKLRRSSMQGDQLILYRRPDGPGPRRSEYEILPVPNAPRTRDLLAAILGVDVEVRKARTLYLLGDTRIHLDRVQDLGEFIEFEAVHPAGDPDAEAAARAEVDRLIDAFGLQEDDRVPVSYRELVLGERDR